MPSMVLRELLLASVFATAMAITAPSIGLNDFTAPNTASSDFKDLYQDAQTVDAAVNWGDKAYFFKGTHWISYDKTEQKVDENFPRPIEQGFPELATWLSVRDVPSDAPKSLLGLLATPAKISAAAVLPPNANRILSPTKPVAVFFKFLDPTPGSDGAVASKGSGNYHLCAYEVTGHYGTFIGAYPSHTDAAVYSPYGVGVTFPEANATALMDDLGISSRLTNFFDALGARMDYGSAVSILNSNGAPDTFQWSYVNAEGQTVSTNVDMIMTYNMIEKRVPPSNAQIASQPIPTALLHSSAGVGGAMAPRPLVAAASRALTLAEQWMPAWRAMIPCWHQMCVGATATKPSSMIIFSASVFWLVQISTTSGRSEINFWSDADVNTFMGTAAVYSLNQNWPKITTKFPGLADFCEPRSTYALTSMKVTFNPPELTPMTGDSDASDGALSQCQETTRVGEIRLFFKLYNKGGLIIYQSQATVVTKAKKSLICLRVEDTTPACDYLIPERPAPNTGAITGKVFVTTTSMETPALDRNHRYEREDKEIISWGYTESVF